MFSHKKCVQIKRLTRSNVSSETNPKVIYKLCRWNDFEVSIFQHAGKEDAMKLRTDSFSHPKLGHSLHCMEQTNLWTDLMHISKFAVLKHTQKDPFLFIVHLVIFWFLFFEGKLEKQKTHIHNRWKWMFYYRAPAHYLVTLGQKFDIIARQLWICKIWHIQSTPLLLDRLLWPNAGQWGREAKAQIKYFPLSKV